MTYRDDDLTRAKARERELEAEAASLRDRNEKLLRGIQESEARARAARKALEARKARCWPLAWGSVLTPIGCIGATVVGGAALAVAVVVWHLTMDIRAGTVTGRDYHPAYVTTSCTTSNGTTTCTPVHHPERWTVDIQRGDESATWGVSQWEYDHTTVGEWFCQHDAPPDECRIGEHER